MRRLGLLLAAAATLSAAVDGVVTNRTQGKPQGDVTVTLIELGAGMKTVGSVKSGPDGGFRFPSDLAPASPHLIQAQHQGVNYNLMLPPGSAGAGIKVDVYNASATPRDAGVSQHMFLLEPGGREMVVSERIVFTNSGNLTYQDPGGTVKFSVPPTVTRDVQVRIVAPQGMPITRPAEKGSEANTYVIRYPMKPGETNIDVSYAVPVSGGTVRFEGRILHGGGPVRFVAPSGVKLDGPFEDAGPIPGTSAIAYTLKGSEFAMTVSGTGTLRASAQPEGGSEDTGPAIEARKPLLYDKLAWVLALTGAMLAVGFVLLLRSGSKILK